MEFSLWYYCSVENVLWVFREYSSVVRIFLQIFGCSLHAKIYLFYIEWKSILINGYKGAIAITNGFLLLNSRGGCKWFFIQKDISIRLKFKKLICRFVKKNWFELMDDIWEIFISFLRLIFEEFLWVRFSINDKKIASISRSFLCSKVECLCNFEIQFN